MNGFKLTLNDAKKLFFDRQAVLDAVSKAERKVLLSQGSYLRRVARNSIKRAKPGQHAGPGQVPRSHTGLLKKFLLFAFNPSNSSVVVGPAKLSVKGPGPGALEHGGRSRVPVKAVAEDGKERIVWVNTNLKPRPFMGPALKASEPKLAEFWQNAVTS